MLQKADFPIFNQLVHGKPLVYLDSAATTQKPQVVLDALIKYYTTSNANVHRGVHTLSDASTTALENARGVVTRFFGAQRQELIWMQNTTQACNAVAYGWGAHVLKSGDVIVVSVLDHHSNIVTWQQLALRTGATVVFCDITQDGLLDLDSLESTMRAHGQAIKLLALPHISNTLGTVVSVEAVVKLRNQHAPQARILIDGAQAAGHIPVDFHKLGVDFYAFSGHKMYGPMGSGGLLVRTQLLESGEMQPWLFGGGMIAEVRESHATFHDDLVERFTAGTPDVASAVGLATACEYLSDLGRENVAQHSADLVQYALKKLQSIPAVEIAGSLESEKRIGSVAFVYRGVHAHDVAQVLDSEGIAVRSGHHCTMPLHLKKGWIATTRASFGVYSTLEDIDALVDGLAKVARVFKV